MWIRRPFRQWYLFYSAARKTNNGNRSGSSWSCWTRILLRVLKINMRISFVRGPLTAFDMLHLSIYFPPRWQNEGKYLHAYTRIPIPDGLLLEAPVHKLLFQAAIVGICETWKVSKSWRKFVLILGERKQYIRIFQRLKSMTVAIIVNGRHDG